MNSSGQKLNLMGDDEAVVRVTFERFKSDH